MLESIAIKGYKSIQEIELSLCPLNVLIGANGAGKSNFVSIFHFLNELVNQNLQIHVSRSGGANTFLYYGSQTTDNIHLAITFAPNEENLSNGYSCILTPSIEDTLFFEEESAYFHNRNEYPNPYQEFIGSGHTETRLNDFLGFPNLVRHVQKALTSWRIYHFHDTSDTAKIKQTGDIDDNRFLRPDGSNLAAYLFLLQETKPQYYRNIIETIRLIAPFFDDFALRRSPFNHDKIQLEWQERGSDLFFKAHALSDGTLRFISLATLLLQPPDNLPATILLDEPELGLHPYAITLLASLLRSASTKTQVIVATQSVTLVNQFTPEDIVVVDREAGQSTFRRLQETDMTLWLGEYSLGELWEKNLIGGRPSK